MQQRRPKGHEDHIVERDGQVTRRIEPGPLEIGGRASSMFRLQRQAGNRAMVSLIGGSAQVFGQAPTRPSFSASQDYLPGAGVRSLSVQRRIGVEVELSEPKQCQKDPPEKAGANSWAKRDIVFQGVGWDLTLDDTPGWPRFNLEFILGGEFKQGFEDEVAVDGLRTAVKRIREYLAENVEIGPTYLEKTADGKPRDNPLMLDLPKALPSSANVQLTAGASLAGLHAVLAENSLSFRENQDEDVIPGPGAQLAKLVTNPVAQRRLAEAYISPADINEKVVLPPDVVQDGTLMHALSAMVSLISTFLANYGPGMTNIKEATPILWKTPLNKFFDSPDLQRFPRESWRGLAETLFSNELDVKIVHPPASTKDDKGNNISTTFTVREWLIELTDRDLLSEADEKYDKSIGGIGKREGGQGPSKGHPLFEFRSFPNTLAGLEKALAEAAFVLNRVNAVNPESGSLLIGHNV